MKGMTTPHYEVQYDRLMHYREYDEMLFAQFAALYMEAFNDPSGAYAEQNTPESIRRGVWIPHLTSGRIILAIHKRQVVGLTCAEPIVCASDEERNFAMSLLEHLRHSQGINLTDLPLWYFSELAVLKPYRNLPDQHIGSRLIQCALRDLSSRNRDGTYGRDDKLAIVTRTDASRSMSKNALIRAGFEFHDDFLQNAENSDQVVERGGHSTEKVWGFRIVYPVSDW